MKKSPQRHCVGCGAKVIGRRRLCLDCADLNERENKRLKDARRPGRRKSTAAASPLSPKTEEEAS